MALSAGIGYSSYIGFSQQTAFRTAAASTANTFANLRKGTVFSPRQKMQPRVTTSAMMPKASQLWQSVALTDWTLAFEYVSNTIWKTLFLAAFGKYTSGAAGVVPWVFMLNNPPVDPPTADSTTAFYNRSLTLRHELFDGSSELETYRAVDCCVNRFVMTCEADKPLEFELSGTGQAFTTTGGAADSFTDVTGTLMTYVHAAKDFTNLGGIYIGTTNPPATGESAILKKAVFTLDNNLRFEPYLGAVAGSELQLPTRSGFPSATVEIECDFDGGGSATDAVDLVAAYIAVTKQNLEIGYYLSATHNLLLKATASTGVGVVDNPQILHNSEGVIGFTTRFLIWPEVAATDLTFTMNAA